MRTNRRQLVPSEEPGRREVFAATASAEKRTELEARNESRIFGTAIRALINRNINLLMAMLADIEQPVDLNDQPFQHPHLYCHREIDGPDDKIEKSERNC